MYHIIVVKGIIFYSALYLLLWCIIMWMKVTLKWSFFDLSKNKMWLKCQLPVIMKYFGSAYNWFNNNNNSNGIYL